MTERELTSRVETAFSFAQDTTKQLITLSTAVFALTLTFLKDVTPKGTNLTLIEIAWGFYLFSIVAGIGTLMSLTGNLERPQDAERDSIYTPSIKFWAGSQIVLFLAALGLTLAFGVSAS